MKVQCFSQRQLRRYQPSQARRLLNFLKISKKQLLLKAKTKIKTPRIEPESNLVTNCPVTIHTVRFHKIIHATLVLLRKNTMLMILIMNRWIMLILHSGLSIHSIFWRPVSWILIKFVNNNWILNKPQILSPLLTLTVVKCVIKRFRWINKMFME